MKIKVRYEVSKNFTTETFDIEDLGLTIEEWQKKSENEKREILMDCMDLSSQPYWIVDNYSEIKQ
jgi:hypothetical protein